MNKCPVKILLLAYGRTGSSLLGETLSTGPLNAYFFEPSGWAIIPFNQLYVWTDQFLSQRKIPSMKTNRSVSKDTVLGLFRCSPSLLANLPKIEGNDVVKRRDNNCEASKVRVIKTISLRKSGVLPWIIDHDDIKVKIPSSIVSLYIFSLRSST